MPSLVVVRSVGAEIRSLPVLAAILNFELSDLNVYSCRFSIQSLVVVRSVGAKIRVLPVWRPFWIRRHLDLLSVVKQN